VRNKSVCLESMTTYSGCSKSDAHIAFFWEMMRKRFNDDERGKFLAFVWGRSRLPLTEADFGGNRMAITVHSRAASSSNDALFPIAHTCGFSLELPRYSTLDIMTARVSYAINYSNEIDADAGDPRVALAPRVTDPDSDDDESSLFTQ